MISLQTLQHLATKHQTSQLNIRREYLQHVFLSNLYQQKGSEKLFFKGGTALRIAFGSARFSEDLDFSTTIANVREIEDVVIATLREIERENIATELIEAKKTSGGYLAELSFSLDSEERRYTNILLEISKRTRKDAGEVITVVSDFIPPYTVVLLDRKTLVAEKIQALLSRGKPRDFYDMYFLLRSGLLSLAEKNLLVKVKKKLKTNRTNIGRELRQFLPKSHWPIIRDFGESLEREIDRFV